ncbi:MAG: hypothetical protein KF894_21555 [Labilithrix sp.]|nr:hypothetical protein [Labilithrix sp.]
MSSLRGIVIGVCVLGIGAQACTLASPTHITVQAREDDTTTETKSSTDSTEPSGGTSPTCGSDDFIKPDLSKLQVCGDGKGHCFDKAKTPMAATFVACANADEVCVPDEILQAGGGTLTTCTSIIGAGACITMSLIPEMEKRGGGALEQDVCKAGQVCAPCTDPTNNGAKTGLCEPIGVHENACDASGTTGDGGAPPAPCCTTNGKSNGVCIAESAVPEAQRDQTKQDTCAAANKCVPAAFVAGTPVKCNGFMGSGVCMDKCFDDMMSFAGDIGILSNDGCGETEVCIPCTFVADKGVPGCN